MEPLRMEVYNALIRDVNSVLKGRATICGGALRSYIEGKGPRDIDIFMRSDCQDEFKEVCTDLYEAFTERYPWYSYTPDFNTEYHAIEIMLRGTDVVISIIKPQEFYGRLSYGPMEKLVKEIDFNVCRLGLREDNTIYSIEPLEDIIRDINNRTLRIVEERPQEVNRVKKRIAKYESYGYTFIGGLR